MCDSSNRGGGGEGGRVVFQSITTVKCNEWLYFKYQWFEQRLLFTYILKLLKLEGLFLNKKVMVEISSITLT